MQSQLNSPYFFQHMNGDALRTLLHLGADPSVAGADGANLVQGCSEELRGVLMSCMLTAIMGARCVQYIRYNIGTASPPSFFFAPFCKLTSLSLRSSLVRRLLSSGLSANSRESGRELLHWAASCGDGATTQALLEAGANANAVDESGATPLHEALLRREEEVATALVKAGADINARAVQG